MAQANRIYILILKVIRFFSLFSSRQAVNNHRSLQRAVLAAENDLLEHNGVRYTKLQFIHGTCGVTGCILAEGVLDSLLF